MAKLTPSVRSVDKETWLAFKAEAAKHDLSMGDFFGKLVAEHLENEARGNWAEILKRRKGIFTKEEANRLIKEIHEERWKFKFRH